jgi:hypothetical protein
MASTLLNKAFSKNQLTTDKNSGVYHGFGLYRPIAAAAPPQPAPVAPVESYKESIFANPFSTAMSGTETGTLQPYVNRMTQESSDTLYGGLLGYQPQSMVAGNAGGTPINSTVPDWYLPSAIPKMPKNPAGLLGTPDNQILQGIFGNRAWMRN